MLLLSCVFHVRLKRYSKTKAWLLHPPIRFCTQSGLVAPKCTQCKTKALLHNESPGFYHFLSHSTNKKRQFVLASAVSFCVFHFFLERVPCHKSARFSSISCRLLMSSPWTLGSKPVHSLWVINKLSFLFLPEGTSSFLSSGDQENLPPQDSFD